MAIQLVSCTRVGRDEFATRPLGRSLLALGRRLRYSIVCNNAGDGARGLADIYNEFIDAAAAEDVLVLVHDDVDIADWLLPERLAEALHHFDIVGVVGNASPDWRQPNWGLKFDDCFARTGWQPREHHSGRVMHRRPAGLINSVYGPWPRAVKVLDGLFIAVRVAALRAHGLRFDPQFRFHCYDIDFCRSADAAGLRIGTWPIALIHDSGGNFASEDFREAAQRYRRKWDPDPA